MIHYNKDAFIKWVVMGAKLQDPIEQICKLNAGGQISETVDGLPDEMKIGIYLAFFDDNGLIITTAYYFSNNGWQAMCMDINNAGTHDKYNMVFNDECDGVYYDTRIQSLKAAIETVDRKRAKP